MWPLHIVTAVGAAMLTQGEGAEGDGSEAQALGGLSLCPTWPQSPGGEGDSQRKQAAAWDVSLAVLGINPVVINQK